MRRLVPLVALFLGLVLAACSKGADGGASGPSGGKVKAPDAEVVRSEITHVTDVLAAAGTAFPGLAGAEVLDVEHTKGDPVAVVTLGLPSGNAASGQQQIKLLVRLTENGWQLYDRDLEDPASSTYLVLRKRN